MVVVSGFGYGDQSFVEAALVGTGLVAGGQEDRLAFRIEGEGHAPDFARPLEAQFLHVGVFRRLERVHRGTPEVWAELRQQLRVRQQFILQVFRQVRELGVEVGVKQDDLGHGR